MIDVELRVLEAEPERVRALHPADIFAGHVLVVAEEKGVRDVRIPEARKPIEGEPRNTRLKDIGTIRPGDLQRIKAEILTKIRVLGTQAEAGEADDAIEHNAWRDGVGAANAGRLDESDRVARLSAVGGVAAGCAK